MDTVILVLRQLPYVRHCTSPYTTFTMMQRSTDYHHILQIRKPIKVIRELRPAHRESDCRPRLPMWHTFHILECGALGLSGWGTASSYLHITEYTKGQGTKSQPPPPPRTVYTALRIQGTHKSKKIHTPLICWWLFLTLLFHEWAQEGFILLPLSPLRLRWNLAPLSFGKIHHLHVNRTSLSWSLTKDKQNGISCHLEL